MTDRRATCLNCMDGRVQLPVLMWIKENCHVDFVDIITEAGMNSVLSNDAQNIQLIIRSIGVSISLNKSDKLFIVGHYDCRGNPVDKKTHVEQIHKSVERIKSIFSEVSVVGLWVNDQWSVEKIVEKL